MESRIVELPNGESVTIHMPSLSQNRKAEWKYSAAFNEAILAGILPREALLARLLENELWTDVDEAKKESFQEQIAVLTADLRAAADNKNEEEVERLRMELTKARSDYFVHLQKLNVYLSNCAEEKANEARMIHLVFLCTTKADGTPYWKKLSDLENETEANVYSTILYNYMFMINGLDTDFQTKLPENSVKVETDE